MKPNIEEPPLTKSYFKFYAEKWDSEYARNALLHFISRNKMEAKLFKWLEKNFPDERYD